MFLTCDNGLISAIFLRNLCVQKTKPVRSLRNLCVTIDQCEVGQVYWLISVHRRIGRFKIFEGGARFRNLGGGKRGQSFQQAHDVLTTSMRRNDVASTSFRRHVPLGF